MVRPDVWFHGHADRAAQDQTLLQRYNMWQNVLAEFQSSLRCCLTRAVLDMVLGMLVLVAASLVPFILSTHDGRSLSGWSGLLGVCGVGAVGCAGAVGIVCMYLRASSSFDVFASTILRRVKEKAVSHGRTTLDMWFLVRYMLKYSCLVIQLNHTSLCFVVVACVYCVGVWVSTL